MEQLQPAEPPAAHVIQRAMGRPILFLHGWGASGELFVPVMDRLAGVGRLVAPDLPGFGATPPPPVPWTLDDYAGWTLDLLDRLGHTRFDVVGHSFGGRIAIKLAVRVPERVGRLVLTGCAGIRPHRGLSYRVRVRTYKAARWLTNRSAMPMRFRRWAGAVAAKRGSPDYQAASGTLRGTFVRIVNEDLRPLLRLVGAPTLLIWGDADTETPIADGRVLERLIPDAGLVVFPGGGHYAYLERVDEFCRIVRVFLGDVGLGDVGHGGGLLSNADPPRADPPSAGQG